VGGSERAVHQLFLSARAVAPCILLLENIDVIAAVRGNDSTSEGTMDRVLSTLLIELDGIEDSWVASGGVAVIGTTQNSEWIDPSLKRPGRLDRVLSLDNEFNRKASRHVSWSFPTSE
jgi:SpoVK/Ycf46/Vps4 family AAA+-type ATPase